ncbi:alpha-N-acetylglucosaminidase isoform X2 [Chelonus insularis]|uniref:alpha-N-acetylglucosaminidase isoform X2 n=1 Tax=Chelonus insularis TaxID=460826 RepID=UPI00158CE1FE|nr:alpha-N-acetylglucosaminidase isoform X2 [Chelonus insularis]
MKLLPLTIAGYSSTWWNWDQWEKNIDWMALNGINLALAFHAQEAIWERVYFELNLTRNEIDQHFAGPAFLPWARMGNIRGWGGPLPPSWHNFTITLQHKILNRMRKLGIIPVLPAFAGHVPQAFRRLYPNANMTKINSWNGFDDKYCCPYLISPQDPLFKIIGKKFLQTYIKEFGTNHVYNCDTFNENEPLDGELNSLRSVGQAIYSAMTDVDPQAIWMLQGWLFVNEFYFWTRDRVKAFITSVPIGKMIILDLQSEQFPQYDKFDSYYGQPFIWCMLHNFGGTLGMFGSAAIINERVFEARNMNGSTMIGTGLTPEGINQNYVIYDLMNEMAYRKRPVNLDQWFKNYASRRYGCKNEYAVEAWKFLQNSVYNFNGTQRIRGHYVITRRPSMRISTYTWYDPSSVYNAWKFLLKARIGRGSNLLYQHDLVDVTRQALQLIAEHVYLKIQKSFHEKDLAAFKAQASLLLQIFSDLESILSTNKNFLVGKWIKDARSLGTNVEEKKLYEFNARNQITLWGPNGEIRDYANKQWAGVMSEYFGARWSLYLSVVTFALEFHKPVNQSILSTFLFDTVEKPFTMARNEFPAEPKGNSIEISWKLWKKWKLREPMKEKRQKQPMLNKHLC